MYKKNSRKFQRVNLEFVHVQATTYTAFILHLPLFT